MIEYMGYPHATGQVGTRMAVVTCPSCTTCKSGNCVYAQTGRRHPSSDDAGTANDWCPSPQYCSVVTAGVVSHAAGVIVKKIQRHSNSSRTERAAPVSRFGTVFGGAANGKSFVVQA